LFVRIPCCITYTTRSQIARSILNCLRLAYPALKRRACAHHRVKNPRHKILHRYHRQRSHRASPQPP
jgi:hypothetical protein